MTKPLSCPVDLITVNASQPRLIAASVVILSIIYLIKSIWVIPAFLILDLGLRAFNWGKYSPLGKWAQLLIRRLHIKGKPVDAAPKRFAAKLGFVLSMLILTFLLLGHTEISQYLAGILSLFALLESAFNLCVGCKIYQWIHAFK